VIKLPLPIKVLDTAFNEFKRDKAEKILDFSYQTLILEAEIWSVICFNLSIFIDEV
jgi:hypothetical protein